MINEKVPIKPIIVGKIGSCYGIRGWIRIFSFTERTKSIFNYQPWFIRKLNRWQKIEIQSWHHHNSDFIIKIKGVDNRNAANALVNHEIIVNSLQFPHLIEGSYYWKDLIGCKVIVIIKNYDLGKVIDIIETGSNDVLVIKSNFNDMFGINERLVPFIYGQVIKEVNFVTQIIEVDWDPGF